WPIHTQQIEMVISLQELCFSYPLFSFDVLNILYLSNILQENIAIPDTLEKILGIHGTCPKAKVRIYSSLLPTGIEESVCFVVRIDSPGLASPKPHCWIPRIVHRYREVPITGRKVSKCCRSKCKRTFNRRHIIGYDIQIFRTRR